MGPTETDMLNNSKGACKDLPSEIRSLFEGFKPYKGGNNALWALNELANTPKHKMLLPLAIGGAGVYFSTITIGPRATGQTAFLAPVWLRDKNQIVFLRTAPETDISYNGNLSFSVALDDVDEVIRGQPPAATLRAMAGEVESVLMATEAECRRLGLIA
jgi:hypothetical protein